MAIANHQQSQAEPTGPPRYPHIWRELISGSLEENFSAIALGSLDNLITTDYLPSPEHIQFLLYLLLKSPSSSTSHKVPDEALSTLYKLQSVYSPSSLSPAIPCHPSNSQVINDQPSWLAWDYTRSEIHRSIWRLMRRSKDDGIWSLLWTSQEEKGRSRKRVRREDNSDDDGEAGAEKKVSEQGWKLLEWLVELWENDRHDLANVSRADSDHDNSAGYSSMFLAQLPRPYDSTNTLQRSDAALPLAVLRSAFPPYQSLDAISNVERERRERTGARVLLLLLDTALYPSAPPFHPASLSSSLVYFLRSLSLNQIISIHQALSSSPFLTQAHRRALGHTYTLVIEDLGGVRTKKVAERQAAVNRLRQKARQGSVKISVDRPEEVPDFGPSSLDWPTSTYLAEILVLPISTSRKDDDVRIDRLCKMNYFKSILFDLLSGLRDESARLEWQSMADTKWFERLEASLAILTPSSSSSTNDIGAEKRARGLGAMLMLRIKAELNKK